jgi:hypothetical protein
MSILHCVFEGQITKYRKLQAKMLRGRALPEAGLKPFLETFERSQKQDTYWSRFWKQLPYWSRFWKHLGAPRSRILIGAVSGNSSNKDSAFGRSQKQDPYWSRFWKHLGAPRSRILIGAVFGNSSRNRCPSQLKCKSSIKMLILHCVFEGQITKYCKLQAKMLRGRALPEAGSLLEPFLETFGRSQKQDPYWSRFWKQLQ